MCTFLTKFGMVVLDFQSMLLQEIPDIVKITGLHALHDRSQLLYEDFLQRITKQRMFFEIAVIDEGGR